MTQEMQPSIYLLHFSRFSYVKNLVFPLKARLFSSLCTIVEHRMPSPVQKVRRRLRLQRRKMRPALWKRLLPGVLIAGCNEFYDDGRLAGSCKVKLYTVPFVVAEGKALLFRQRYSGDHGVALGACHNVVPSRAYCRGSPEAKIAYKKLSREF
jgi:hypothetical protein